MCLHEPLLFTNCPCKLTRLLPCENHLAKQKSATNEANKHWFLHFHTYSLSWDDMSDIVLDTKLCPLFHEEPILTIDGDCGMMENGCPYVGKETEERVLDDALLEWGGGGLLFGSGSGFRDGVVDESESYREGGMREWRGRREEDEDEDEDEEVMGDWKVKGLDGMSSVRRSSVRRSSVRRSSVRRSSVPEKSERRRKGSLHIDTSMEGYPERPRSSFMDKPLSPPPGMAAVSPEPVDMDPRHVLAMIPNDEERVTSESESSEEIDPRVLFHRFMGFG